MDHVTFIDSSGIRGLVFLQRLQEHGHTLKVVGARGQPLASLKNYAARLLRWPHVGHRTP